MVFAHGEGGVFLLIYVAEGGHPGGVGIGGVEQHCGGMGGIIEGGHGRGGTVVSEICGEVAEIVEILGHMDDPGVDILSIIYKYDINVDFPDDVKREVAELPMEVSEREHKGRRDLREEEIFTRVDI